MSVRPSLQQYKTGNGLKVYRLPLEAFPNHFTNCYLVLADEQVILIDAASGWETANRDMLDRFEQLREIYGESVTLADVKTLIITHGHIDHFGGIHFVKHHAPQVKIGIHELDARIIEYIDERIILSSKSLEIFLEWAGLSPEGVNQLTRLNKWSKGQFAPCRVDFLLDSPADHLLFDLFKVYHTPGHCPGQVCLQLDDILFSADHILARITPVQSPEAITRYTGLGHYLDALREIKGVSGVRLVLGGHEMEVKDLAARVDEMRHFHEGRLEKTFDLCDEPRTIKEISKALFPNVSGYNVLLALLETGAHVEYLYQRGKLRIANLGEVEEKRNPAIRYERI